MNISLADAERMYESCLLMYKGRLVYLIELLEDEALVYFLESGEKKMVPHNEYDEFSPPAGRLGYVNTQFKQAIYLFRSPVRQYRVGFTRGNVGAVDPWGIAPDFFGSWPFLSGVEDTLKGIFPSLEEALQLVGGGGYKSVAFDRQFAVNYKGFVYYKGAKVGQIEEGKVVFFPEKSFLTRAV